MKTILQTTHKTGIVTRFITIGKFKFKLRYECTNGTKSLCAFVMTGDGQYECVLTKYDVGDAFAFTASYVSAFSDKLGDAERGMAILETMLTQIYK